jgi:hypothetical protein
MRDSNGKKHSLVLNLTPTPTPPTPLLLLTTPGSAARHTGYNILKADKTPGSLRRKGLRACIDSAFWEDASSLIEDASAISAITGGLWAADQC